MTPRKVAATPAPRGLALFLLETALAVQSGHLCLSCTVRLCFFARPEYKAVQIFSFFSLNDWYLRYDRPNRSAPTKTFLALIESQRGNQLLWLTKLVRKILGNSRKRWPPRLRKIHVNDRDSMSWSFFCESFSKKKSRSRNICRVSCPGYKTGYRLS